MFKIFTKNEACEAVVLADGTCVSKCAELITLCNCLDELNAFIGWGAEALHDDSYQIAEFSALLKQLYHIQSQLFALGRQLAVDDKFDNKKAQMITEQDVVQLEIAIDVISNKLPNIRSFVLPGGGEIASRLYIIRSVCRRAERAAFCMIEKNKKVAIIGDYLNRLDNWFFVAARFAAFVANVEEVVIA